MKSLFKYIAIVLFSFLSFSLVFFYIIPYFNGKCGDRTCAIISAKYIGANSHYDTFSVQKVTYNYKEKAYRIYLHSLTSDKYITYEITVENIKDAGIGIAGASEIECSVHDDMR